MSRNNIFNEYMDNQFNKEKNLNVIYSKIKKKNDLKRKILGSVSVLLVFTVIGTVTKLTYAKKNWDKEYNEYLNRYISYSKVEIENQIQKYDDQTIKIDMDYMYRDGIGVKINSLSINDYTCKIGMEFKITDDNKKGKNAFEFGFAVYDDENNIYIVDERVKYNAGEFTNYGKKLCKELGIPYKSNIGIKELTSEYIKPKPILNENDGLYVSIELKSIDVLPKTEKLHIRIYDIGYALVDENGEGCKISNAEDFQISNSEWQFDIEIPEETYYRTFNELILTDELENIKLENALLTENSIAITLETKYSLYDIAQNIKIIDETGAIYDIYRIAGINKNKVKLIFYLDGNSINKILYMGIIDSKGNIDKKIELIKK